MAKLDSVLTRVRDLPPDRQDLIAFEIDLLLNDEQGTDALTDEQWADLRQRAAEPQGADIPHEVVAEELKQLFAR